MSTTDFDYQQRGSEKSSFSNLLSVQWKWTLLFLNSLKIVISIKSLYVSSFLESNFDNFSYVANVKTPSTCNEHVIQEQ